LACQSPSGLGVTAAGHSRPPQQAPPPTLDLGVRATLGAAACPYKGRGLEARACPSRRSPLPAPPPEPQGIAAGRLFSRVRRSPVEVVPSSSFAVTNCIEGPVARRRRTAGARHQWQTRVGRRPVLSPAIARFVIYGWSRSSPSQPGGLQRRAASITPAPVTS
jgi:hypothetical protein